MLHYKRFFLLGCIWGIIGICSGFSQTQLERISITERGDGNGYVLRYHLAEMVDSFELIQPETNLIQMQLFSDNLDTAQIQMPELNDEVTGIDLTAIDGGLGVEITTSETLFFSAQAYPDQNMRDLLVNIEYAEETEVRAITSETERYEWSVSTETEQEMSEEEEPEPDDEQPIQSAEEQETPQQVVQKKPVTAKIGVSVGVSQSNKVGGNFSSDSRQEFVMGFSAGISLPFILPYSIGTGIETGVYFVQKGFLNPSTNRFDGESVILDYVEVPVLARFDYDFTEIIKPKIVGGIYTAFRANAEAVQSDGDRNDLNDVTNAVDVGLAAGVGSDILVESTVISLQAGYSVSTGSIFSETFSGNERLGYFSLLLSVRF